MGGFGGFFNPAPNPAPNPSLFAQSATSSYAAGLQFATALRAAAEQHAQHEAQQRQEQFSDQLRMREHGGTPLYDLGTDPESGRPSLMRGKNGLDAPPPVDDPTHVQSTPWGDTWHVPSTEELKAEKKTPLDDTNSFQLSDDLAAEAKKAGFTNLEGGSRLPHAMMPSLLERLKMSSGENGDIFHTQDTDGTVHLFRVDRKTGKGEETGTFKGAAKTPAEKPDATSIIPGYTGPGGGPVLLNKGDQTTTEIGMPPGSKRTKTEEDKARDERFKTREEDKKRADQEREDRVVDALQAKYDDSMKSAREQRMLAEDYRNTIGTANYEKFIEPATKVQKIMDASYRTSMARGYMRAKAEAEEHEKKAANYQKSMETRRSKSGGQSAAPAAARPQAKNAQTGETVEWDGKAWVPASR